jgi:hypothetical protein
MWLPTPVYERIPQLWFLFGLLFVAYGLYVGLDIATSIVYLAVGLAGCFTGACVAALRSRHRRDRSENRESQPQSK